MNAGNQITFRTYSTNSRAEALSPSTRETVSAEPSRASSGDEVSLSGPSLHTKIVVNEYEPLGTNNLQIGGSPKQASGNFLAASSDSEAKRFRDLFDLDKSPQEETVTFSGSGLATPIVSGVAAALLGDDPDMPRDELKAQLQDFFNPRADVLPDKSSAPTVESVDQKNAQLQSQASELGYQIAVL